jgi:hypothetical protein
MVDDMRVRAKTSALLAAVVLLAGCSSTTAAAPRAEPTMPPLASTKLICSDEAASAIAAQLGVQTTQPLQATWVDQTYSCPYVYADGVMTLSVKQLDDATGATAYYKAQEQAAPGHTATPVLGADGFATPDGTLTTHKDTSVFTVDVSKLPATFGAPSRARGDLAFTVSAIVLTCWAED